MSTNSKNKTVTNDDESQSEDLDVLLDQVDKKYFSREAERLSKIPPEDCECTQKQETNWEEVDEILKDFKFEDTNPYGKHKNNSWIRSDLSASSSSGIGESSLEKREEESLEKCNRLLIAGSYEQLGFSQTGRERPCDNLKCIRCDFKVLNFDNFAWDSSTDYLFLRNSMPDFHKLAVKLEKKKGWRAYACQCQNLSINKIAFVDAKPELKWVCGKHNVTGTFPTNQN